MTEDRNAIIFVLIVSISVLIFFDIMTVAFTTYYAGLTFTVIGICLLIGLIIFISLFVVAEILSTIFLYNF